MDIYLVRHGEAASGWSDDADPGLSQQGWEQAETVADTLAHLSDVRVVSSPLLRAQQTAAPLAARVGLPVEKDTAFREVPAPVPLGQRQAWLRQFMKEQWSLQVGALLAWRDTARARLLALESPTVVFTHFLVLNAVVGQVLGREDILCFWPDNGSITQMRRDGDCLSLVELGAEMQTSVN
ncbi:MAG: histidine phosphatase family protein [Halioglobus sp.]|nr:histidine phosphatase family protein [Halioglobus sp.]